MMESPLPVIVQGVGPIGAGIVQAVAADPGFALRGAVDIDPALVGQDALELAEAGRGGPTVRASLAEARDAAGVAEAIVLQATGSYLDAMAPQVEEALELGLHVVSTCEELSYPFARFPAISERLDALAREAGRTVVATGVNPGFVMDLLVVVLSGASREIRSVRVRRVQNPGRRRRPFQEKVGLNVSRAEYERLADSGKFGHVGLEESARLAAAGLGWQIDHWRGEAEPVQPDPAGPVRGMLHVLEGETADGRRLQLHFEAHGGVEEDCDEITIEGRPPLQLRFLGGVFGDDATLAALLRAARVIPAASRGLLTVLDLPLRVRTQGG